MVNIEIDGKKIEAEAGSMIIEVADANGVYIPRFCYHKKLSVAANCRMCLVEVANVPKPVPACATPVADGMVVKTKSPLARAAQKAVMEFLLINHPLDCPICDQGGECELQDLALGYGEDVSRYTERKRVVRDKDIGPLIETELTRCIHCTRCVRFGTEIAGMRELGMLGRGEYSEIGTFVEKSVESEVSGNVIDLCPVGALTAKPSRYQARPWELNAHKSVAAHDCLGSNIEIHTRRGRVIRVVPAENESINEVWLSDRDRFSYEAIHSPHRLQAPMIKENGAWTTVDWHTALSKVVGRLNEVLSANGADALGALASPSSTTEELYLLQKLVRALGSHNIDHRLHQTDFSLDSKGLHAPVLEFGVDALERLDATLLVGSNIRMEQPIAALRLRKSTRNGQVFALNQEDYPFNFKLAGKRIARPKDWLAELANIAVTLGSDKAWIAALAGTPTAEHKSIADALKAGENSAVILGAVAQSHPAFAALMAMTREISILSGAKWGVLSHGANAVGAHVAGALPVSATGQAMGKNAKQIIDQCRAFILLGCEPGRDSAFGDQAVAAFKNADFVVALSAFANGELLEYADVLLPIGTWAETSGTYFNACGQRQTFQGAIPPVGEARPAWKVLRVLGNFMELEGFDYTSTEEIMAELGERAIPKLSTWPTFESVDCTVDTVKEWSIYDTDMIVRRAKSLQMTTAGEASRGLE